MSEYTVLPTNLVDDELAPSNERRRYRMIDNGDGTYSFEEVTTYTTVGSNYGASQINAQNEVINQLNEDLNDKMNSSFVSAEEEVGTWFGEPLYRKCFTDDTSHSSSITLDNALNTSNIKVVNIDEVYKIENEFTGAFNFLSGSNRIRTQCKVSSSGAYIAVDNIIMQAYRVAIYYTKTT